MNDQTAVLEPPFEGALAGDDADRFEIVNGVRVELDPMSVLATGIAFVLAIRIDEFGLRKGLGRAFTEMLFVLDGAARLMRRPDVAFVPYAVWPDGILPETQAWDVTPAVAVEVVSPSNRSEEIDEKLTEYFAAGVALVWIVYPKSRRVQCYTSLTDIRVLDETGDLDGGDVLPGFRLAISELFAAVTKPQ